MTTREADKLIKDAKEVTVIDTTFGNQFTTIFTRRDRHTISTIDGGKFERRDLKIINQNK